MADRFTPPFTLHANESTCWLEDAAGVCFAYTYYDRAIVGTGVERPTRKAALRITRIFSRAPEWVRASESTGADPAGARPSSPKDV